MDKYFARSQPQAAEFLHKLASHSKPWKDYMRETSGGADAKLGSYATSMMRPDFTRAEAATDFENKYSKRWLDTGLIGDNSWRMYKDALPADWEMHPKDPIHGLQWMKLHEKNPLFLSKFLNAQGMPYAPRYSGLKSGAHAQLLVSVERARHLGLLPVWGNPYHLRNQRAKPAPRLTTLTKDHLESYRSQWMENERIKQHFAAIKKMSSEAKRSRAPSQGVHRPGGMPHFPPIVDRRHMYEHKRFHYAVSHVNPLDAV
ncbi:hypothetical protein DIPPA_23704 [Diplonema papillatum]|nr:hypothetical protein DIPPA_23704 [Diplonema papillatum]